MSSAARLLTSVLDELLTPAAAAKFDQNGYLVFSPDATEQAHWHDGASTFLSEVISCHNVSHATSPNKVEFLTTNGPVQLVKPHIFEHDLHDRQSAVRKELHAFDELVTNELSRIVGLFKSRCSTLQTLMVDAGGGLSDGMERHVTVKIQANEGGCFPWHYDNPGPPNKRLLTLAVYLTPAWTESDGGELVLQPFLGPEVRVSPELMSIAMFRSDTICHRVRPFNKKRSGGDNSGSDGDDRKSQHNHSCGYRLQGGGGDLKSSRRTRYCFTIWFDGSSTNSDEDVNIRVKHLQESFIDELKSSPLQRTLSRAVYSEAYKQALEECFGEGTKELRMSLAMHEAHCKNLMASAQARSFVEELRSRYV